MPTKNHPVPADVKSQILDQIKNQGSSVRQLAAEHGLSDRTIYSWMRRSASAPPTIREVAKLRKDNQALLEIIGKLTVDLSVVQKKEADYGF